MGTNAIAEVTQMLRRISGGDRSAADRLMPMVYDEFRGIAGRYLGREKPGHTLQPTDLVHEAYLKLVDQKRVDWQGRTHFFAVGAMAMRRILANHARDKGRLKRGGSSAKIELRDDLAISGNREEEILAIDEALNRLAELDPRHAKVVELRFFGGLTGEEVAEALGVTRQTVQNDWRVARAWLRRELSRRNE
jgi:RNA polymerase sigma factor (TIGR02999 family)